MNQAFFFQIEKITDHSSLFDYLKVERIFKFYLQIYHHFSGKKSKILFGKIKKKFFRNFYLDPNLLPI